MKSKDTFFSKKYSLNCRGKLINLSTPKVMGILNVTPDSFYDGGKYITEKEILKKAEQMIEEGAFAIDVGAYSSRPGAEHIPAEVEIQRLGFSLAVLRASFPDIILSADTFRSKVARMAVTDYEVDIINDITSGNADENMISTIAELNIPYIMMHIKGTPQNMQKDPSYDNVIEEIINYFSEKIQAAKLAGISDIIIDPGFGFGKTTEHNYRILNRLDDFKIFELPILVGFSRKSMIYKPLNTTPQGALNGTSVLNTIALMNGASILRVHDVKEAMETIKLYSLYHNSGSENYEDH
ncbi:MAG: dihydropteroate synthase [Bacteroidales bacterium]|nr:MAG: dihydropteroate synthase [Bacteroidales bacterium]